MIESHRTGAWDDCVGEEDIGFLIRARETPPSPQLPPSPLPIKVGFVTDRALLIMSRVKPYSIHSVQGRTQGEQKAGVVEGKGVKIKKEKKGIDGVAGCMYEDDPS